MAANTKLAPTTCWPQWTGLACGEETFDRVRPQLARDVQLDPADMKPLFFGYRASPDTRGLIADSGGWLAFPKGMIVTE